MKDSAGGGAGPARGGAGKGGEGGSGEGVRPSKDSPEGMAGQGGFAWQLSRFFCFNVSWEACEFTGRGIQPTFLGNRQ